ncbi:MAG: serine/threonine-protein phosphatase [Candidatus Gastranaerophilales bacterium]|nr:serine/threonine-protein phosphatase [Candidatus Gastranaerophilales bacterium]
MKVWMGCISDKGNYREKNQDRAVCHVRRKGKSVLAVACVCDGIGSFERSEIAAEMMTSGISRWFHGIEAYYPTSMGEKELVEDLNVTICELNELVYDYRMENGIEIGCTMSVMLLVERNYYIFHAGDSRIYCVRDGLLQITRDEVTMKESHGKVKPRLANYIGKSKELWMNVLGGTVEEKDVYLLGSDGLFKKLLYEDVRGIAGSVKNDKKAQKVCKSLLDVVLERGERDNVSCILLAIASVDG